MIANAAKNQRAQPRIVAMYGVIGMAFVALIGQLWNVQIANGPQYRQRAEVNRVRVINEKPVRGVIYDRSGRQVARNVPSFTAGIRPADLPRDRAQQREVFERLGRVIDMSPDDIRATVDAARQDPFSSARVKSPITREQALIIEEQLELFPGVVVDFTPIRAYPEGPLLGHILGYTGPIPSAQLRAKLDAGYQRDETLGITGVESAFEDEIKGSRGRKQVEVDALGRVTDVLATLMPTVPGDNLVLTVDVSLQRRATEILSEAMAKTSSNQASLVALQPQTGDVLAMVSLPEYDHNLFAAGISSIDYRRLSEDPGRPLVNHAIAGQYPPGSTFKLVTAAAALQEKVVTPQTTINCPGSLTVSGTTFGDNGIHGSVNVQRAIAVSCNVFFYSVAGGNPHLGLPGLRIDRLADYARVFGFGEKSGIRLGGEQPGLIPTREWKRERKKESWYIGDDYNVGIGQGDVLATPLQLANMVAAIANGGTLYRPRLVKAILPAEGEEVKPLPSEVIRKLPVAPEHLAIIRAGMRDTVAATYGSAYWSLRQPSLTIAGKTGTAEFSGPRDSRGRLPTHAVFVGYAPHEDPQIAVAVIVYGGGEGSQTAAPVAADLMKAFFELGLK
jgi:penicillin-binding protein 2